MDCFQALLRIISNNMSRVTGDSLIEAVMWAALEYLIALLVFHKEWLNEHGLIFALARLKINKVICSEMFTILLLMSCIRACVDGQQTLKFYNSSAYFF